MRQALRWTHFKLFFDPQGAIGRPMYALRDLRHDRQRLGKVTLPFNGSADLCG